MTEDDLRLQYAIEANSYYEVASILAENPEEINLLSNLCRSIRSDLPEIMQLLMSHGIEVNMKISRNSFSNIVRSLGAGDCNRIEGKLKTGLCRKILSNYYTIQASI